MKITLKFSGGLETLAGGKKEWLLELEETNKLSVGRLIKFISCNIIAEGQTHLFSTTDKYGGDDEDSDSWRKAVTTTVDGRMDVDRALLFGDGVVSVSKATLSSLSGGLGIKAGVLVLVNDVDWEMLGCEEVEVVEGDVVDFISTLHGG
eukprot:GHVS01027464.1.p2 GENE.GHVS01027464.1~~GHVS01027464.1.p2  ORF type:complete len:149 (+),score=35.70 GHVS01027464.1:64-510(+)